MVRADPRVVRPPHPVASELELQRARRGDREAVGALWRIYQPQVLRFLKASGSVQPEDVASQVWIDVGRGLQRFEGDGRAFQRWIFTIARRRNIDAHRTVIRLREVPLHTDDPEKAGPRVDDDGTLDEALDIVRLLPRDMAEAVMLNVISDLSASDVATITGHSEANVRVLVHRGLKRLRENVSMTTNDFVRPAS
jgi:RNA polymerase sigma-70 factor (ECF subfamily)